MGHRVSGIVHLGERKTHYTHSRRASLGPGPAGLSWCTAARWCCTRGWLSHHTRGRRDEGCCSVHVDAAHGETTPGARRRSARRSGFCEEKRQHGVCVRRSCALRSRLPTVNHCRSRGQSGARMNDLSSGGHTYRPMGGAWRGRLRSPMAQPGLREAQRCARFEPPPKVSPSSRGERWQLRRRYGVIHTRRSGVVVRRRAPAPHHHCDGVDKLSVPINGSVSPAAVHAAAATATLSLTHSLDAQ